MKRIITYKPDSKVSEHPRLQAARGLCETLRQGGWSAYWVGGAVRDLLLKPDIPPGDIDIATDAPFNEICKLLPQTRAIGRAFGVGLVCEGDFSFEVATFRKESDYSDRRHPSLVGPGTLEEDSQRRDFTVNALYLDPLNSTVTDFHDGISDLKQRILRCVGDAKTRLHEDPLRILRLYRFAANTQFTIAPETERAAQSLAKELVYISKERVLLEVAKLRPEGVHAFGCSMHSLQNTLLGAASSGSYSSQEVKISLPEVTAQNLKYPGTLFALMCAVNEGFSSRQWPQTFKSWPLSAEEKAHLELFQKVGAGTFELPTGPAEAEWKAFMESIRWLQRQARTKIDAATLLFKMFSSKQKPTSNFLTALESALELCLQSDSDARHQTLTDFIESQIKKQAQPLRDQIQKQINADLGGSALGWARAIVDTHALLNVLGCPTPTPWNLNSVINEETIVSLCETAKRWSQTNGSHQSNGAR